MPTASPTTAGAGAGAGAGACSNAAVVATAGATAPMCDMISAPDADGPEAADTDTDAAAAAVAGGGGGTGGDTGAANAATIGTAPAAGGGDNDSVSDTDVDSEVLVCLVPASFPPLSLLVEFAAAPGLPSDAALARLPRASASVVISSAALLFRCELRPASPPAAAAERFPATVERARPVMSSDAGPMRLPSATATAVLWECPPAAPLAACALRANPKPSPPAPEPWNTIGWITLAACTSDAATER